MRERVQGKVRVLNGVVPQSAEMRGGRALLTMASADGSLEELAADRVIASTGYRVDLRKLPFLDDGVRQQIRAFEHMPSLTAHFESSVPGLYFIGISSALTFGPMMRFAYGSAYTARRLARHLAVHSERRQINKQ
jgi:hypothetical protein